MDHKVKFTHDEKAVGNNPEKNCCSCGYLNEKTTVSNEGNENKNSTSYSCDIDREEFKHRTEMSPFICDGYKPKQSPPSCGNATATGTISIPKVKPPPIPPDPPVPNPKMKQI